MPAFDRPSLHLVGPVPPERERSAPGPVPNVQRTLRAPQGEQRAAYLSSRLQVRLIVCPIDRRRGPIFFAYGVRMRGIAQRLYICGPDGLRRFGTARHPNGPGHCRPRLRHSGRGPVRAMATVGRGGSRANKRERSPRPHGPTPFRWAARPTRRGGLCDRDDPARGGRPRARRDHGRRPRMRGSPARS